MGGGILGRFFMYFSKKRARRAGFRAQGAGRPSKCPSAKPKDVGGTFRSFQIALKTLLRSFLLLDILGFLRIFNCILTSAKIEGLSITKP